MSGPPKEKRSAGLMMDELMQGKLEGYGRGARQRAGLIEVLLLPYLKP